MIVHFLVAGRVQGVGFRWFVHRAATEFGLCGWVRNTEEGDVEVLASGEETKVDALRNRLWQGTRSSRVDRISERYVSDEEAGELDRFRIDGAW